MWHCRHDQWLCFYIGIKEGTEIKKKIRKRDEDQEE